MSVIYNKLKKNNFHKEKNLYVIPEIDEARSGI